HIETAGSVDCHAVTVAASLQLCEVAPVGDAAVGGNIERENATAVRDVQHALIGTQHDPVRADVVAETGHTSRGVDVVGTADSEVDTTLLVGDEIVEAPEWLALEAVSQHLS